jgi:hypothetical protein
MKFQILVEPSNVLAVWLTSIYVVSKTQSKTIFYYSGTNKYEPFLVIGRLRSHRTK